MLHASDELRRMTIHAVDGEIGRVNEFYFDDASWTLRYSSSGPAAGGPAATCCCRPRTSPPSTGPAMSSSSVCPSIRCRTVPTSAPINPSRGYKDRAAQTLRSAPVLGPGRGGGWRVNRARCRVARGGGRAGAGWRGSADALAEFHEVTGYRIEAEDGGIGHVIGFLIDPGKWRVEALLRSIPAIGGVASRSRCRPLT